MEIRFCFHCACKTHCVLQSHVIKLTLHLWTLMFWTSHFTSSALGLSRSCLVCTEYISWQTNQNHIVKRIFEGLVIFSLSLTPSAFRSLSAFGTLPLVVISARTWAFHSLNVKWHQLDIKLLFNLSLLPRLEDSHSIHQAGATELKYC